MLVIGNAMLTPTPTDAAEAFHPRHRKHIVAYDWQRLLSGLNSGPHGHID
jgi:hypothetical protein